MPGTIQLTRKDILYRLQASKAKCIVASEEVAPAVDSIVSECPSLKTKLLCLHTTGMDGSTFRSYFSEYLGGRH